MRVDWRRRRRAEKVRDALRNKMDRRGGLRRERWMVINEGEEKGGDERESGRFSTL